MEKDLDNTREKYGRRINKKTKLVVLGGEEKIT